MTKTKKSALYSVIGLLLMVGAAIYFDKVILDLGAEQFVSFGFWFLTFLVFIVLAILATPVIAVGVAIFLIYQTFIAKRFSHSPTNETRFPLRPFLWVIAVIGIALFFTSIAILAAAFPLNF